MPMRGRTEEDEETLWAEAEIMIAPGGPLSPGEAVDLSAEHADASEDEPEVADPGEPRR